MAGRRIERKLVRVQQDAVTGELHRTVLDPAQLAFERARGAAEEPVRRAAPCQMTAEAQVVVLAARAALVSLEQGADPGDTAIAKRFAGEWERLDAPGRTKLARLLREWLKRMVPYRDADLDQGEAG